MDVPERQTGQTSSNQMLPGAQLTIPVLFSHIQAWLKEDLSISEVFRGVKESMALHLVFPHRHKGLMMHQLAHAERQACRCLMHHCSPKPWVSSQERFASEMGFVQFGAGNRKGHSHRIFRKFMLTCSDHHGTKGSKGIMSCMQNHHVR